MKILHPEMSVTSSYSAIYLELGGRPLPRPRKGYDAARRRDSLGGPPTVARVTHRARQLIDRLEAAWHSVTGVQGSTLRVMFLAILTIYDPIQSYPCWLVAIPVKRLDIREIITTTIMEMDNGSFFRRKGQV